MCYISIDAPLPVLCGHHSSVSHPQDYLSTLKAIVPQMGAESDWICGSVDCSNDTETKSKHKCFKPLFSNIFSPVGEFHSRFAATVLLEFTVPPKMEQKLENKTEANLGS